MERIHPCPVCKKPVEPRRRNPGFPFCSDRCRRIDLGRWFGEEYRVPSMPADDEEQAPSPVDPPER
ncbi:MAG TPA: DNA gyrase inhibitor YacG [Myxococcaceae bacterium]